MLTITLAKVAEAQPKQSVVVMMTKDQLFVQGELVASLDEVRAAKTPLFEPLRAVLTRPLSGAAEGAPEVDLAGREITMMGDKTLAYDVVKKVMATCTAADYGKISLAVLQKDKPAGSGNAKSV